MSCQSGSEIVGQNMNQAVAKRANSPLPTPVIAAESRAGLRMAALVYSTVSIFITWFPILFREYTTTTGSRLKALLIRIDEVHESLDVFAMRQTRGLLAHLEPRLHLGVILFRIVEHALSVRRFHRVRTFHVLQNPITNFAVGYCVANHVDKLFCLESRSFQ